MGSLDAAFIAVEDATNHMHIGSVGIFEGPPPSYADVVAVAAAKLQLVPRYRQRVREAPASIGRPLWIDDIEFDLDYHMRHAALPHRDRSAHPLDRRRPLWEMWMIEGLDDDRWALVSKVHHCMVDGIAGSDLLGVIMDLEPDAPRLRPAAWQPAPEPSYVDLARYTGEMTFEAMSGVVRGGLHAVRHPRSTLASARRVINGLARVLAPTRRAGASLTGPIGPRRRWRRTRVSLDDVKAIRAAFGGTVNDVALTAVTRGFRELLSTRGESLEGRAVITLVPVSTRPDAARGVLDNRVSAVYARLPVGVEDPVSTLEAVRAQMDALKASSEPDASDALVGVGDFAPPIVAAALARTIVHSQEIVQTVATNVPGPQLPLYVCGRRMLEAYPFVPIAGHVRVGVAIWSYCGEMYFGVTGDWQGAPDIGRLVHGIDVAFETLRTDAAAA
jgi:WS/DGAT/MGAT family acyltransferase